MIELLELKNKLLDLFESDIDHLGEKIMQAVSENNSELYDEFCNLIDHDLSEDWMQKIFQYYHADRKEKKQDYTPKSLADFMGRLVGNCDTIVDMCAGTGALTIQKWNQNHNQKFILYEFDEKVIPYLLFNLSVRNIESIVYRSDVLQDIIFDSWKIEKGNKYGTVTNIKSTV